MDNWQKVRLITIVVAIGFVLSVLFHYIMANYLGYNYYPYNTFLYNPTDRFEDFFQMIQKGLNPYGENPSAYGPLTFILLKLLNVLPAKLAFVCLVLFFVIFIAVYIYKSLPKLNILEKLLSVFVLVFMSYPVLFIVDRGNVEMLLFVALALFGYFYLKGQDLISVFFLSIAISLKFYPAVFLVLFLADNKYRNVWLTILFSMILSIFSAVFLETGVLGTFRGFLSGFYGFNANYINSVAHGLQHNVSLFSFFKIIIYGMFMAFPAFFPIKRVFEGNSMSYLDQRVFFGDSATAFLNSFNLIYPVIVLVIFSYIVYLVFKEKESWKRFSLLIFSMLLLPQMSFDYKLIYVLIPMLMFINSSVKDRNDLIYVVLFSLLLIPKDYYILSADVSIAVVLNPVIMLMILFIIGKNHLKVRRAIQ